MEISTLTEFLGWSSAINIGMLAFSTLMLCAMRKPIISIHSRLSGVAETELPGYYFSFLANYKIAILVLNVAPYLALRIIS